MKCFTSQFFCSEIHMMVMGSLWLEQFWLNLFYTFLCGYVPNITCIFYCFNMCLRENTQIVKLRTSHFIKNRNVKCGGVLDFELLRKNK